MTPDVLAVLLIVGTAIAYVGRKVWLAVAAAKKPKSGCGSDCGCGH